MEHYVSNTSYIKILWLEQLNLTKVAYQRIKKINKISQIFFHNVYYGKIVKGAHIFLITRGKYLQTFGS